MLSYLENVAENVSNTSNLVWIVLQIAFKNIII